MTRRAWELLEELQDIFGESFGYTSGSLLSEADRKQMPRGRNADKKIPKRNVPAGLRGNTKKTGMRIKDRRALRKRNKEADKKYQRLRADIDKDVKDYEGKKAYNDAMKSIRADMDKSDERKASGKSKAASRSFAAGVGGKTHHPFKRSPKLGPGPRQSHHNEKKCWSCTCGNVYTKGCKCVASGNGANCPTEGTIKKIKINKSYKDKYNPEYHEFVRKHGTLAQRLGKR